MSNLTNNTAELNKILAAVNALPEAGEGGGINPTGEIEITENGTYDVMNYATAAVNVPSEDLTAEIEAQAALIEEQAGKIQQLLTVLDGKAAGGGSTGEPETCTLQVVGVLGDMPEHGLQPTESARIISVSYPYIYSREDEYGNRTEELRWMNEYYEGDYVEIEGVVVGQTLAIVFSVEDCYAIREPVNAEVLCDDGNSFFALFECTKANDTAVITIASGA